MKKSIITGSTLVLSLAFFVGSAMAGPSAKFAAIWSNTPSLVSMVNIQDAEVDTGIDPLVTDSKNGYKFATIKVPQGKELLVGLSAEIGLVTDTSVKGREGGSAKALAGAEAFVNIYAVPTGTYDGTVNPGGTHAIPRQVMLSSRVQELTATLGGVFDCSDTGTITTVDGECTETCFDFCGPGNIEVACDSVDPLAVSCADDDINIACECGYTDEQIGLMLDTTAAHHFNFILPNMDAGEYDIVAIFSTGARAEIDICDSASDWCGDMYDADGWVSASAYAKAVINKYVMTVQQVRAINSDLFTEDVIEIIE